MQEHQSNQPPIIVQQQMSAARPANFPHLLHFVLTLFTAGVWLPIWILHRLFWRP